MRGAYSTTNYYTNDLTPVAQGFLAGLIIMFGLVAFVLIILQVIGMWKTFKKAKQKGWAAIIPFYNIFTIIKIAGLELWWFAIVVLIATLAPSEVTQVQIYDMTVDVSSTYWTAGLVAFVTSGFINYKLAKSFNKKLGFAVGLTCLPPIFWMILGFSEETKYVGPAGPYKIKYPEAKSKKE